MATAGRRLAVGIAIAGLIAGCGGGDGRGDDEADASTHAVDAVPGDLAVSFVTAGGGAGWVAGAGAEDDAVGVWRLTPDGAATQVADLPDLMSMDGAAVGDQLAVAGLRCVEGDADDPADGCGAWEATALLVDDAGAITEVILFADDTGLDDGDGLAIAGSARNSVWISTERGLFEVSTGGAVVRELPDATGGACVIDESLYRVVNPEPGAAGTHREPGPPVTVDPTRQAAGTRSIEIQRLDGDTFTPVPGGGREIGGDAYVNLTCTGTACEAAGADGVLADRWTPTGGWQLARGVPAPATAAITTSSGAFALDSDGTVVERTPDGAFVATGMRLPNLSGPGLPPPSLIAYRSPSLVVACTTRSTSQIDTETACRAAAATGSRSGTAGTDRHGSSSPQEPQTSAPG